MSTASTAPVTVTDQELPASPNGDGDRDTQPRGYGRASQGGLLLLRGSLPSLIRALTYEPSRPWPQNLSLPSRQGCVQGAMARKPPQLWRTVCTGPGHTLFVGTRYCGLSSHPQQEGRATSVLGASDCDRPLLLETSALLPGVQVRARVRHCRDSAPQCQHPQLASSGQQGAGAH